MTTRQEAIEIVYESLIFRGIQESDATACSEFIVDALLASDFCSDSVRELVKKIWDEGDLENDELRNRPWLTESERELLRSIVEDK